MNTIKVAVAGIGFIGPAHVEALRRLPGIEVVAISDISMEAAEKKAEELGITVDTARLEHELGIPVVATVSTTGRGLDELRQRITDHVGLYHAAS